MTTDDSFARQRQGLSTAKRALLEQWRRAEAQLGGLDDAIPHRPAGQNDLPLTPAQRRLWFLERLDPGNPVYHLFLPLRLDGPLNVPALEYSLRELAARHEPLRTTFGERDGEPFQRIHDELPVSLPVTRRAKRIHLPTEVEETEYARFLAIAEWHRPFNLETGPPWRVALHHLGSNAYLSFLTMHHLVSDGWSLVIAYRELATLYAACRERRPSPLPALPTRYGDVALWHGQREPNPDDLAYWTQQLANLQPVPLPTDRRRSIGASSRGARQSVTLPAPLVSALTELGRQEGATVFMTLLAALQMLLMRGSGEEDIAIGVPTAGRNPSATEGLVGFFVNTLVIRGQVTGEMSFRHLLRRVRGTTLDAYAHQSVHFEEIVAAIRPERTLTRSPLISVAFAFHNQPTTTLPLADLKTRVLDIDPGTAPFELTLHLRQTGRTIDGWIEYATDLFDPDSIARVADRFHRLLNAVAAAPDSALAALPILSDEERHTLLVNWSAGPRRVPCGATIHQRFEAVVAQSPTAIALVDEDQTLTYEELNRRANRLAYRLRRHGIAANRPIGILLERSPSLIISMLGILKAGGAYMPLDPSDPPARLATIVAEARCDMVITEQRFADRLPAPTRTTVLLDAIGAGDEAATNLPSTVTANDLAYVIFTSGTTGSPKGVAVPHRAVSHLVRETDYVQLRSTDVVAQAATATFDAATFEIWGALLNGARLVLIPSEALLSPSDLRDRLRRHQVSVVFLTTAVFNQIALDAPVILQGIGTVLFGGEAAAPEAARSILHHGPPDRLIHVYGPTESTTFATWFPVTAVASGAAAIPIGRPIAGNRVFVLDGAGEPVPIGVPGELVIGGAGLAHGYLHQPTLTAERFVSDPFSCDDAARFFHTGDYVRYRADGNLEFLGRRDRQIKLRGHRIALAEVETTFRQHPAVARAVVTVRWDGARATSLTAYIVPEPGASPTTSEILAFVRDRLPRAMVPAAVVTLSSLPMTTHGKIDFDALPAKTTGDASAHSATTPRSALEAAIAAEWADLLGVSSVGSQEDFFFLGGHSLLVPRVLARLKARLGVDLPVRALFEAPTVAALAIRVAEALDGATGGAGPGHGQALIALQRGSNQRPVFAIPGGDGGGTNLFKLAQLARYLDLNRPFYGFLAETPAALPPGAVQQWVETTATAYIEELRHVQSSGPYLLTGTCVGGILAFEMAQQLLAAGEQVAGLILLDTVAPDGTSEARIARLHEWQKTRGERQAKRAANVRRRGSHGENEHGSVIPAAGVREEPGSRGLQLYLYEPRPYPARLTLLINQSWHQLSPALGWDAIAANGLDVRVVGGDHRTYFLQNLAAAAEEFQRCLAELDPALQQSDVT